MGQPRVGIVVLTYNGLRDTVECLESLRRLAYPSYEVLVVDNVSTDGTAAVLRKDFPEAAIISVPPPNRGFAPGMNAGLREALRRGYDYIFAINNDTTIDPACLAELVAVMERHPEAGCVSPTVYYDGDPGTMWQAGQREPFRRFWIDFSTRQRGQDSEYQVDIITGTALLLRPAALRSAGLFAEDYYMYYEDFDLCLRFKRCGYQVWCAPRARLWHKISATYGGSKNPVISFYKARNIILLLRRFYPWYLVTLLPFYGAMIAANFVRAAFVRRRLETFWALLRGFGYHFRHNHR